jgi:hypothetical protein
VSEHREDVPVGRCCCCDQVAELPNLMMLDVRGPDTATGKGWGCAVCGLPADGAMAALCRRCIPDDWQPGQPKPAGEIRFACTGYVSEPGRVPRAELVEAFEHDSKKHAAYEQGMAMLADPLVEAFDDDDDDDDVVASIWQAGDAAVAPFTCGVCGRTFDHPEHAPVLGFPHDASGRPLVDPNDPHGDIVMLNICDECVRSRMSWRV